MRRSVYIVVGDQIENVRLVYPLNEMFDRLVVLVMKFTEESKINQALELIRGFFVISAQVELCPLVSCVRSCTPRDVHI